MSERGVRYLAERAAAEAARSALERTLHSLDDAVTRSDERLREHTHAALDFLARVERSATAIRTGLAKGNVAEAARAASQLSALARLVESRVHLTLERRVAVLQVAEDVVAALPPPPSPPPRSVDRLRRMVERDE